MTEARFEIINHTADIGLRISAPTLDGLIWPATRGLYEIIGELQIDDSGPLTRIPIQIAEDNVAILLRDYLNEILYLFSQNALVAAGIEISEYKPGHLDVVALTFPLDEQKSVLVREIKAITYHELSVIQTYDGFEAIVIVDI